MLLCQVVNENKTSLLLNINEAHPSFFIRAYGSMEVPDIAHANIS
jgi:hypothetical protein